MLCWKCGKELDVGKDCACDSSEVVEIAADAKNVLDSALERADKLGEGLAAFKEKIKKWKESSPNPIKQGLAVNRDINRNIHFLCLMADELEEKVAAKTPIRHADIKELEEKALYIAELAKRLTGF
jgi:hypothetical protein